MTDEQIKQMVERFLCWKLPENFNPDAGISFEPKLNVGTPYEMKHEPTGTNLFDYTQAEEMVRHMVGGLAAMCPSAGFREHLARALSIPEHHTTWDRLSPIEQSKYFLQAEYAVAAIASTVKEMAWAMEARSCGEGEPCRDGPPEPYFMDIAQAAISFLEAA